MFNSKCIKVSDYIIYKLFYVIVLKLLTHILYKNLFTYLMTIDMNWLILANG